MTFTSASAGFSDGRVFFFAGRIAWDVKGE
jgi:hypothetical protein